jgi:dTDP-glucose 4,6-dehydratase
MHSLLVTGGAGFIGANFMHYWRREHPADSIVVLDALTYAGNRMSLSSLDGSPGYSFTRGDIADQPLVERVLREHQVDTVVHFAAESHVDRSILGPDRFIKTNIVGTHNLLKACRQVWLLEKHVARHRFHHVSTDEVYGSLGPTDPPFHEATPYAPNSPYAATKAASDHLVRAYSHTFGLETTTTNCSNNYGPFHFPEKLIPLAIVNILLGCPLPIYGDGRNVRDWLFVEDHCRAIDLVLSQGRAGESYNVGGRAELENIALVRMLCELADSRFDAEPTLKLRFPDAPGASGQPASSLIKFVPDRPGHDRRYAVDGGKVERELAFRPAVAPAIGLEATLSWFIEHEAWWRAAIDGSYRHWIAKQYGSQPG